MRPRAGLIPAGWYLHPQRLVWSLQVVHIPPGIIIHQHPLGQAVAPERGLEVPLNRRPQLISTGLQRDREPRGAAAAPLHIMVGER